VKHRVTETTDYAQMGIAALLPGMQYMIERMQSQLDEMRAHLSNLQNGHAAQTVKRPRKANRTSGWPTDPEERKAEGARRMAVRMGKAKPKGQKGPTALGIERKKQWAAQTPKQRKARIAAMMAGKRRKLEAEKKLASKPVKSVREVKEAAAA
jgi:hypothetical protein